MHHLRAQLRDALVLFQEFRHSLLFFVIILFLGAIILHFLYTFPDTAQHPSFSEGLYGTFSLIFFQPSLPFPDKWYLQVLFFIIPIVGLAVIADGVLRFSAALANKKERGQNWQVAMASTYSNHIIVCGVGKVGYRVIHELLRHGREVVAIDSNAEGRFIERVMEMGVPLLIADARRSANIIKAGVKKASAIVPCTDDELTNLDVALDAREINPNIKVVMRMFDPDLAKRAEKGFGIHTAFSASALTAPFVAAAAMRLDVKSAFYLEDDLVSVSEIVVQPSSTFIGWTLHEFQEKINLTVVWYGTQNTSALHPAPQTRIQPGAKMFVLGTWDALEELQSLNKSA